MISSVTTTIWIVFAIAAVLLPIILFYWLFRKVKKFFHCLTSSAEQIGERLESFDEQKPQTWHRPGLLAAGSEQAARLSRQRVASARWNRRKARAQRARRRWESYGL